MRSSPTRSAVSSEPSILRKWPRPVPSSSVTRVAQAQYAQRFSEACLREIGKGFDYATNEISDPQRRFKVFANLLILVNEFNDPRLVDLGIRMIPHETIAVRYWAVRVATNPSLWEKLNQDQAAATATVPQRSSTPATGRRDQQCGGPDT